MKKRQDFVYVELNIGNTSAMGAKIALYGEWIQGNKGLREGVYLN